MLKGEMAIVVIHVPVNVAIPMVRSFVAGIVVLPPALI
jgi:hypothetical protein